MIDKARVAALWEQLTAAENDSAAVAPIAAEILRHLERDDAPILWANLQGMLGASLAEVAAGHFTPDLVSRILDAYHAALTVYDRQQTPAEWAHTQRNVGVTHLAAAQAQIGNARKHL